MTDRRKLVIGISNLRRLFLSVSGKKCYFCDVITATLLFQWLRLKGVCFSRVRNDNGLERRAEKIFLLQKQIMVHLYVPCSQKTQYITVCENLRVQSVPFFKETKYSDM